MKLVSPLPHRRGRIEIIPLIDIMFFLLAAFMMVSLDMVRVKSLKINLPTDVPAAQKENKEDFISISVKEDGTIGFDKDVLPNKDVLLTRLQQIVPAIDLNVSPKWEFNFGVGVGVTRGTDHLIVKMIIGRRIGKTKSAN